MKNINMGLRRIYITHEFTILCLALEHFLGFLRPEISYLVDNELMPVPKARGASMRATRAVGTAKSLLNEVYSSSERHEVGDDPCLL